MMKCRWTNRCLLRSSKNEEKNKYLFLAEGDLECDDGVMVDRPLFVESSSSLSGAGNPPAPGKNRQLIEMVTGITVHLCKMLLSVSLVAKLNVCDT